MKTYNVPIVWQSYKRIPVQAENLQEAVTSALKQFLSEPDEQYVEDSFEIDEIIRDEHKDEDLDLTKIYNQL